NISCIGCQCNSCIIDNLATRNNLDYLTFIENHSSNVSCNNCSFGFIPILNHASNIVTIGGGMRPLSRRRQRKTARNISVKQPTCISALIAKTNEEVLVFD